ncbi:MAG TPA: hypothetical protein P5069_05515 [Candidatus Hydrogenedentes bacterium]|nr:hypothetical protein [Candidatus Hydrogenedentota bacterium]
MAPIVVLVLFLGAPLSSFTGTVAEVRSGDQMVMVVDGRPRDIRLSRIKCPAPGEPYGEEAKQYVSRRCAGNVVEFRGTLPEEGVGEGDVFVASMGSLSERLLSKGLALLADEKENDEGLRKAYLSGLALQEGVHALPKSTALAASDPVASRPRPEPAVSIPSSPIVTPALPSVPAAGHSVPKTNVAAPQPRGLASFGNRISDTVREFGLGAVLGVIVPFVIFGLIVGLMKLNSAMERYVNSPPERVGAARSESRKVIAVVVARETEDTGTHNPQAGKPSQCKCCGSELTRRGPVSGVDTFLEGSNRSRQETEAWYRSLGAWCDRCQAHYCALCYNSSMQKCPGCGSILSHFQ